MFQKSVLDKYIKSIDAELLEQKYKEFQNTYQNPQKIENMEHAALADARPNAAEDIARHCLHVPN